MPNSPILLLLLVLGCCTAYMRKSAEKPGFAFKPPVGKSPQLFVKLNSPVEPMNAEKFEHLFNTTVASANESLIANLFDVKFKLNVCKKEFDRKTIVDIFVKDGRDYKFKVKEWVEQQKAVNVDFTVLIRSKPLFTIKANLSTPNNNLTSGKVLNCRGPSPSKTNKLSEVADHWI